MSELTALVKTNLKVRRNLNFGSSDENSGKESSDMGLLAALFLGVIEFYVINGFDILKTSHKQQLVFKGVLILELVFIVFYSFKSIINTYYLASDWKEISIYPIKPRILLIAKCEITSIENLLISSIFIIPLFTYGGLVKEHISYYIYVVIGSVLIAIIPVVYITLISLTIFWIAALIKKTKSENRNNKLLIAIDAVVTGLSIGMLNNSVWIKAVAVISAASFAALGLYLIGGNVYFTIMKSEIFSKADSKVIETDISKYKFHEKSIILSNITKDLKELIRVPVLRLNCITVNVIVSLICIVLIFLGRNQLVVFDKGGYGSLMLIPLIQIITTANFTSITSFSREGSGIVQFKVFPIDKKIFLISKICVGLITNIFAFIASNVYIIISCNDLIDFISLEIIAISYIFMMVISHTKMDSSNINSNWVDIKEVFQFEHAIKIAIPLIIITIVIYTYLFVILIFKPHNGEVLKYITFIYFMTASVIYSAIDIKKLKRNILK